MRGFVSSPGYRAVALVIARARRDAGVSQRELAKRIGTLPSMIAKIETGARRMDVIELIEIARALSIAPEALTRQIDAAVDMTRHE